MRPRVPAVLAFTSLTIAVVLGEPRVASAEGDPPPFLVVVPRDSAYAALDRVFVADAFLKKATRWPNGDVIKPVDRNPDAAVREHFSRSVLKRSVGAVKSYWQQIIFSGRDVPPPEVASDEDIVKYVTTHKGAIGYVSGGPTPEGVRVVVLHE
jgi:hypothetical protein